MEKSPVQAQTRGWHIDRLIKTLLDSLSLGQKEFALMEEYLLNKEDLTVLSQRWRVPLNQLAAMKKQALTSLKKQITELPILVERQNQVIENLNAELDRTRKMLAGIKEDTMKDNEKILSEFEHLDIDKLKLSTGLKNALRGLEVRTLGELRSMTKAQLLRGQNLGIKRLKELETILAEMDIFLPEE